MNTQRRPGPPGADPDRRSDAAARQRAQDHGHLVHGRRGVRPTKTGTSRTPPRSCRTTRSGTRWCRSIVSAADFVTGLTNADRAASASRPAARVSTLHQPPRRDGQQAALRHPERPGRPRRSSGTSRSRSRPVQDQLSAPAELRQALPVHRRVRRQLHPGQPLVLHRHPDRRAGQPAVPRPGRHPAGRHAGHGHQERIPELPVRPTSTGPGQTSIASGVLGGEIQLTDRLRADLGVRVEYDNYRAELGEHLEVRPRRQPHHHLRQRDVRERQLPPLHQEHHRLGRLAGAQLPAERNMCALRLGGARLQDAGAGRVPERDRPGAGGPVRGQGGPVGRGRRQVARSAAAASR